MEQSPAVARRNYRRGTAVHDHACCTQQCWEESVRLHTQALKQVTKDNITIAETEDKLGANFGTAAGNLGTVGPVELRTVMLGRGRVWNNCTPEIVRDVERDKDKKRAARVTVATDKPSPTVLP